MQEELADQLNVGVGDAVDLQAITTEEFFAITSGEPVPDNAADSSVVAGTYRQTVVPEPLTPKNIGAIFTSAAWFRAHGATAMNWGPVYSVWLDGGKAAEQSFADALPGALPDKSVVVDSGFRDNGAAPRAIGTQAAAWRVVALLILLAVFVFVGQSLVRQLGRELADAATMRALGMTRSGASIVAAARVAPIVGGGLLIAVLAAVLSSPIGPVGLGRRAEVSPGIRVDWPVIALGSVVMIVAVVAFAVLAAQTQLRRRSGGRVRSQRQLRLPATAQIAQAFARNDRGRFSLSGALLGGATGLAAVTAAFVLLSSLTDLRAHRERVGTTFAAVRTLGFTDDPQQVADEMASNRVVTAISAYATLERALPGGLDDEVLIGIAPKYGGGVPLVVLEGRAPQRLGEIALGTSTMHRLGLHIGDMLAGVGDTLGTGVGPLAVVGRIIVPTVDAFTAGMGHGAVVTMEQRNLIAPPQTGENALSIATDPSVSRFEALAALRQQFGESVFAPAEPSDMTNLQRISATPIMLGGVVVVLAGAALVHALVTTIRRRRHDIGVVQALGFTRSQVSAAVAWQATGVILAASAVGLAVGVIGGRWGWGLIERRLGIVSPPHVPGPVAAVVVVVAAAALFANLVAAVPGWRAARVNVAEALRAD